MSVFLQHRPCCVSASSEVFGRIYKITFSGLWQKLTCVEVQFRMERGSKRTAKLKPAAKVRIDKLKVVEVCVWMFVDLKKCFVCLLNVCTLWDYHTVAADGLICPSANHSYISLLLYGERNPQTPSQYFV